MKHNSLENTPTWAVSIVCLCLILISLVTDIALHNLTQCIRKRKRKSLSRALEKLKTEMMTMGFISLLLTISEVPVSKICVAEAVANSFSPCKDYVRSEERTVTNTTEASNCEAKMRRWKAWEKETESLEYQVAHDPRRFQYAHQTAFGQRHLRMWSHHPILLWPVCFIRQFTGSASKADYFTLRNGFIVANVVEGSHFNVHKFLVRAFDHDFEQIVGIRFWIWIFFMLFLFLNAKVIYTYYWLPFIPLLLALTVGTKLQVVITKMCVGSSKNSAVVRGTFPVKPSNEFFWFNKLKLVLYLLQLILIQYEYGLDSCFNREKIDVIIRITTGVGVQLLCGFVTLPIYAIVTQMSSDMKKIVFTESVTEELKYWLDKARKNISNHPTKAINASMDSELSDTSNRGFDDQSSLPQESMNTPTVSISTTEITEEEATSMVVINGETYDGEISFWSYWKNRKSKMANQEISSIIEEDHASIVEGGSDKEHNHVSNL